MNIRTPILKIWLRATGCILVFLVLGGCMQKNIHVRSRGECFTTTNKNVMSDLLQFDGMYVCIYGAVRVVPHGVYYQTPINEDALTPYGGKITLPISYGDGVRANMKDGDFFKYSGYLTISKDSNCSGNVCYAAQLNDSRVAGSNAWQYKEFNELLYQSLDNKNIPSHLINTIKKDYRKNPWREGYNEIGLIDAFRDANNQKRYLMFSITYVSDIYVVYEVNEENKISGRFLLSQW